MYLIGAPHRNKIDSQRLLEQATLRRDRLVTDAEVFQEILHRYSAINRREFIRPAFDVLLKVVDEVLPIDLEIVKKAKEIVLERPTTSARNAIHVAVMRCHHIEQIMTMDGDFDSFLDISRML